MSLADTLITIFVLAVISALLIAIYFTYSNYFLVEVAYKNLNSNNVIALNRMSSNIKSATKVVDSKTINGTPYTTDSDTLILELPSVDASDTLITGSYDYLVYFRNQSDTTQLKSDLEVAAGSARQSGTQLVADSVETLIFNYNNTTYAQVNKVEIVLASSQIVRSKKIELGSQTTAELRNK